MQKKDIWLGKTFGKYRVVKFIGKGTMGSVYQALSTESNKKFAIKIFDLRLSQALKQKWSEFETPHNLKHENIIEIHDKGEEHGTFYVVMDYIDGKNLLEIIEEKKKLDYEQVLNIARGVIKALVYANKKDVLHRDIKPTNILIDSKNKVFLSDFSTTKIINSVSDMSQLDKFISTVFYVSPEQSMGTKKIDFRSDFYSLGITIFQLLTGQIPYPGRTPLQVMQQHISSPLPKLSKYDINVPSDVERLITKLTAKKPEDRYQTAEEVLEAIQEIEMNIQKRKNYVPILPAWLIGVIVFIVLFFVGFFISKKILIQQNIDDPALKSIGITKVSLINQDSKETKVYKHGDTLCIHVFVSITKTASSPQNVMITFKSKYKTHTENINILSPENISTKYCCSAYQFPAGQHEIQIDAVIDNYISSYKALFLVEEQQQKIIVSVSPEKITLAPKEQIEFTYKAIYENGGKAKILVYWEASGGEITNNGIYSGGDEEGTFFIYLKDNQKNTLATATATIKKPSNRRGWFGEQVPEGILISTNKGEYEWEKDNSTMIFVPQGKFYLGSNDNENEGPVQEVYLEGFYVDKYEITVKQYLHYCKSENIAMPEQPHWSTDQHPVVNVSWNDAMNYANWIGKRLLSEKEWEKAAKGGLQIPDWRSEDEIINLMLNPRPRRLYPWGDQYPNEGIEYRCNYVANDNWDERHLDGYKEACPVDAFPRWRSPYGCVNLSGNVWEWCVDSYRESYNQEVSPENKWKRILRGGSWYNHAMGCRTTRRFHGSVEQKSDFIGIRLGK